MLSNDVGLSHESAQPVMNSDGPQERRWSKRGGRWRKKRRRGMVEEMREQDEREEERKKRRDGWGGEERKSEGNIYCREGE